MLHLSISCVGNIFPSRLVLSLITFDPFELTFASHNTWLFLISQKQVSVISSKVVVIVWCRCWMFLYDLSFLQSIFIARITSLNFVTNIKGFKFFIVYCQCFSGLTLGSKSSSHQFYCCRAVLSIKSVIWRWSLVFSVISQLELFVLLSCLILDISDSKFCVWNPGSSRIVCTQIT